MRHPRFSGGEIVQRGQDWYEQHIRLQAETKYNIGRQIVIDIETGEYEVDEDGLAAIRRLLTKRPDAALYGAYRLRCGVLSWRHFDADKAVMNGHVFGLRSHQGSGYI